MTISKKIEVTMEIPEEISEEDAENRLFTALYEGLCKFSVEKIDFVYCD